MSADAYESCINSAREEGLAEGLAEGEAKGKQEGLAEGEAKGKKDAARLMLAEGMSPEAVSRCTKLSIEEVLALRE
jgi:predicted transposase/invertase (TIGR01784 family)